MDDLDLATVSCILRDGVPALQRARSKGLRPDLLRGAGQTAYQFLVEYQLRFDTLPPSEALFGKTGIQLPEVPPNLFPEFLVDEVFNRNVYDRIRQSHKKIEELMLASPPDVRAIAAAWDDEALNIRKEQINESGVQSLFSLGPEIKAHYERMKAGERGILTPWPLINEATLGFWPMDLVVVAARSGQGKTWIACLLALHAWSQGKRVLFASTEISKLRIALRMYALMLKLPYKDFNAGRLTMYSEPKFFAAVEEFLHSDGFFVVGGDFDFRVETFSAAIDEVRPDFVILDGAYLLRSKGQSRTEQAANGFDEMKRICVRHKLPMVVTHQFNREVKTNVTSSVKAESLGLTDVANWNASLIFGLVQTDDQKRDKRLIIKPLKVREGVCDEVEVMWDLDSMDFSEIGKVSYGRSDSDAGEFDSGVGQSGPNADVPF